MRTALVWVLAVLAVFTAGACNLQVPSETYLAQTTLIATRATVTELGPIFTAERAYFSSSAALTEAMPGDRVEFEAVVVDRQGERLPAEELESLWFQCGTLTCATNFPENWAIMDRPCDELDASADPDDPSNPEGFTTDSRCRLGLGDGRFDFEVPRLGQAMVDRRVAEFYGVVAWGGRSAESCWAERKQLDDPIDGCAFMRRSMKFGPSWLLLVYGDSLGLEPPVPVEQIPGAVFSQPPNRAPILDHVEILRSGKPALLWTPEDPITVPVEPGDRVELRPRVDEIAQLYQVYFQYNELPDSDPPAFFFTPGREYVLFTPYSTNELVIVLDETVIGLEYVFAVDEGARPGRSRVLFRVYDSRWSEEVVWIDFDVE